MNIKFEFTIVAIEGSCDRATERNSSRFPDSIMIISRHILSCPLIHHITFLTCRSPSKITITMARYISNRSSNRNSQMTERLDQESTVLASCYTVESSTPGIHGFHYCTTLGAGKPHYLVCGGSLLTSYRRTVVSLRSPQGLNHPFQVLPSSFPLAARNEAGHGTTGLGTKGRQRTPSRKSVRGFSVTYCSRHSLVRGLA